MEIADDETFEVMSHDCIETSRKDVCYDTKLPYTGHPDEITEWAIAVAMAKFRIGQVITLNQFARAVKEAMVQQVTTTLVEKGLIEEIYDPKTGDSWFRAKS